MDSFTHIVIGAAIGETILGKKIGNKALLWGALISTVPDLDVFITPFINPVDALFFHRGISHSLLFALLAIPIIGWTISKVERKLLVDLKSWILLSAITIVAHLAVDCFNTYGSGIFEPFSNLRVAYDSMAIIDIFIAIPFLILLIWILFLQKQRKKRRVLAWAGICFMSIYFGFTVFNKINIETIIKEQLANQKIKYNRILTSPLPLTNFMWIAVAEDDNGFNIGYYCNFDNKKDIKFRYLPRNNEYLGNLKDNTEIKQLIHFTKNYYAVDSTRKGTIIIHDLRFGSLDFEDENAYVFSFTIKETTKGIEISRSHPDRKINYRSIKKYLKRVIVGINE